MKKNGTDNTENGFPMQKMNPLEKDRIFKTVNSVSSKKELREMEKSMKNAESGRMETL